MRNLTYKYRCGGSWGPTTSFQTDGNGQTFVNIGCSNWDGKITMTLNQTTKEQDVTINPVLQAAKATGTIMGIQDLQEQSASTPSRLIRELSRSG